MTANRWAELRQVGFATLDHAAAVRTATELLALGPGFGDPLLAELGLADFTAPVGPGTYVEVLAPVTPGHPVARWLGRVGGSSGWVLSTQVPSLDGVKERAAEHGVRVVVETQAMGHDIIQLHPLDVGVLLELDAFLPRDGWFWDVPGLCEQMVVLYLGRVAESWPTRELLARPAHPYTLALRSAVPEVDAAARRSRIILPGDTPQAGSTPPGCPFHPRCPLAIDVCRTTVPPLQAVAPGRHAACHRAGEVLSGLRPEGAPAQLAEDPGRL